MDIPYSKSLTMQSAAAATGNGTVFDVSDFASLGMQISGTFVGTVTFECTVDNTNWVSLTMISPTNGAWSTTATAVGVWCASITGLRQVRARVSAYTSGSITVSGYATTASGVPLMSALLA